MATSATKFDIQSISDPLIRDAALHAHKVAKKPQLEKELCQIIGKVMRISVKFAPEVSNEIKQYAIMIKGETSTSRKSYPFQHSEHVHHSSANKRIFYIIASSSEEREVNFHLMARNDAGIPLKEILDGNNEHSFDFKDHGHVSHLKLRNVHFLEPKKEPEQVLVSQENSQTQVPTIIVSQDSQDSAQAQQPEQTVAPQESAQAQQPEQTQDSAQAQRPEQTVAPQESAQAQQPEQTQDSAQVQQPEQTAAPQESAQAQQPEQTQDSAQVQQSEQTAAPQESAQAQQPEQTQDSAQVQQSEQTVAPQESAQAQQPEQVAEKVVTIYAKFGENVPSWVVQRPIELRGQIGDSQMFWNNGIQGTMVDWNVRSFTFKVPADTQENLIFKFVAKDDNGYSRWQAGSNNFFSLQGRDIINVENVYFE